MSANKENFPKRKSMQYGHHWGDVLHHYDPTEVTEWFKRCVEDFPDRRDSTFMEEDFWEIDQWKKRWFSQFRNKGDKK